MSKRQKTFQQTISNHRSDNRSPVSNASGSSTDTPATASPASATETGPLLSANSGMDQRLQVLHPDLPQGGGAITGLGETFQTTEFSGTASLNIPLPITPARGLEPALSVDYGSGNGNGLFGLGWALSLPSISRQTSKGVPRYTQADTFLFSGVDYLVPKTGGVHSASIGDQRYQVIAYWPRSEGRFHRIEQWVPVISGKPREGQGVFWRVTTPENIVHIFGRRGTAQVYDPSQRDRVFRWCLEETFDSHGNHILYEYRRENTLGLSQARYETHRSRAQVYPVKVKYGNNQPISGSILLDLDAAKQRSVQWHFEIVFDYGEYEIPPHNTRPYTIKKNKHWTVRTDPFSMYDSGFELRTYRLCRRVLLFHRFEPTALADGLGMAPSLVRVLTFEYTRAAEMNFLRSVQSTGYRRLKDKVANRFRYQSKSLPALRLDYRGFQPEGHAYQALKPGRRASFPGLLQEAQCHLVDLYSDGISGVLFSNGKDMHYARPHQVKRAGYIKREAFNAALSALTPHQQNALWAHLVAEGYLNRSGQIQPPSENLTTVDDLELDPLVRARKAVFAVLKATQPATPVTRASIIQALGFLGWDSEWLRRVWTSLLQRGYLSGSGQVQSAFKGVTQAEELRLPNQFLAARSALFHHLETAALESQPVTPGSIKQAVLPLDWSDQQCRAVWEELTQQGYIDSQGHPAPLLTGIRSAQSLILDTQFFAVRSTVFKLLKAAGQLHVDYAPFQSLASVPTYRRSSQQTLMDVTGNGQLDLVVVDPLQSGYYTLHSDGRWTDFKPFHAFPTDFNQPNHWHADLTGDGLTDVLCIEGDRVRYYPRLGRAGFSQALSAALPAQDRLPRSGHPQAWVQFARLTGGGLAQLVRIRSGLVECWPSLGYGRFGEKVELANAPRFGKNFSASRIRMVDIDGNGLSDLAYVYPDRVEIYRNESGNGFSRTPIRIELPAVWDSQEGIDFADIYGTGTACLVVTQTHPVPRQWVYDCSQGQKPHVLTHWSNGLGAEHWVSYTSSVHEHLRDRAEGLPWVSHLPFPVSVVRQVQQYDAISGSRYSQAYRYHHGYYDGEEREFRGFGRVDRIDQEHFEDFLLPATGHQDNAATPVGSKVSEEEKHLNPARHKTNREDYDVAPVFTKTWYHTGVYRQANALLKQYQTEYWQGDPQAHRLPETAFVCPENTHPRALEVREANRTLQGAVLRTEVYGKDGTPWAVHPYTVSETQFQVRQLQRRGEYQYSVFLSHVREQIEYHYERNPADPRVTHQFTLAVDDYGHVTESSQVVYGRRQDRIPSALAQTSRDQQIRGYVTYETQTLANRVETSCYRLGVPIEQKSYQIKAVSSDQDHYWSWDRIKQQITTALTRLVSQGATPSGSEPYAHLLNWERHYYFDPDSTESAKALPLGQADVNGSNTTNTAWGFTPQALHCRTESIAWDIKKLQNAFKAPSASAQTMPSARELESLLVRNRLSDETLRQGGYIRLNPSSDAITPSEAAYYYWNPGSFQGYGQADTFYQPSYHCTPFFYQTHAEKTEYTYDAYRLRLIKAVDPAGNQIEVKRMDYQTLSPVAIEDNNGNIQQVLQDPLGRVIATSHYGTEGGAAAIVGFKALSDYQVREATTFQSVVSNPSHYLQGASSFFYEDTWAWEQTGCPVRVVSVVAEQYSRGSSVSDAKRPLQVGVAYSDGLGRALQTKQRVEESGEAYVQSSSGEWSEQANISPRWLCSGRVRYNNKGLPIEQFEPYYTQTAAVVSQTVGVSSRLFYDPLGRTVLVESPQAYASDGTLLTSLSKTLIGEYRALVSGETAPPITGYLNQRLYESYDTNTVFSPSAWTQLSYSHSDCIQKTSYYAAAQNGTLALHADQKIPANEPNHAMRNASLLAEEKRSINKAKVFYNTPVAAYHDSLGRVVQSEQLNVSSDVEKGVTYSEWDIDAGPVRQWDTRQSQANPNFKHTYALNGQVIKTESADAGTSWQLLNVLGQPLYAREARGYVTRIAYDRLHRPIDKVIIGPINNGETETFITERNLYVDRGKRSDINRLPWQQRNALGQSIAVLGPDGLTVSADFALSGGWLSHSRVLIQNYQRVVNWEGVDVALDRLKQRLAVESMIRKTKDLPDAIRDLLESTVYTQYQRYDALGRIQSKTDPDGNRTTLRYYSHGGLKSVQTQAGDRSAQAIDTDQKSAVLSLNASVSQTPAVKRIDYNAKGQRIRADYGNGVTKRYAYHPCTHQLIRLTGRPMKSTAYQQDIQYTYDVDDNITHVYNAAIPTQFFSGHQTDGHNDYTYDALSRLVKATGREHASMLQNAQKENGRWQANTSLSHGSALRRYTETFAYDASGNLTTCHHQSGDQKHTRTWTLDASSNRLIRSHNNDSSPKTYTYDAEGHQLRLDNLQTLIWDYHGRLQQVVLPSSQKRKPSEPDAQKTQHNHAEYYVYDGGGQRVRKVWEAYSDDGKVCHIKEVLYLGEYEIRRQRQRRLGDTDVIKAEWHEVAIADDTETVCRWRYCVTEKTKADGQARSSKQNQLRYQLTNHLGSSTLELDDAGQILSYEEYYAYGGTSILAAKNQAEVKAKHYRYSGQEKDESTGLYYYGMRYYCPWLCRWISTDPAGTVDGLNLYAFVRGNPVTLRDDGGMMGNRGQKNNKNNKNKKNKKATEDKLNVSNQGNQQIADNSSHYEDKSGIQFSINSAKFTSNDYREFIKKLRELYNIYNGIEGEEEENNIRKKDKKKNKENKNTYKETQKISFLYYKDNGEFSSREMNISLKDSYFADGNVTYPDEPGQVSLGRLKESIENKKNTIESKLPFIILVSESIRFTFIEELSDKIIKGEMILEPKFLYGILKNWKFLSNDKNGIKRIGLTINDVSAVLRNLISKKDETNDCDKIGNIDSKINKIRDSLNYVKSKILGSDTKH